MTNQAELQEIIIRIENLQNSRRLTQPEQDALTRAKSALMGILE